MSITHTLAHYDLSRMVGQEIVSYGRIFQIGDFARYWFIKLRTADCVKDTQLVMKKTLLKKPSVYSTLQFRGTVQTSPKTEEHEIRVDEVLYYGEFKQEDLEIEFTMPLELLRKKESQRLLTKRYQTIMHIYQLTEHYLHQVSRDLGLMRVRAPFITFSDCEGGGEVFSVHSSVPGFFKKPAYLTVSGQVDQETITSRFMCPTYIMGPSFRSDPSTTSYHACEFFHYEPEIPFITLEGLMDIEEKTMKSLFQKLIADQTIVEELRLHLELSPTHLETITKEEFARVSYTDAVKILQHCSDKFEVGVKWGDDLRKEHEKYLCEEHFKRPTFVYCYPSDIKSFYMKQCEPFIDREIGSCSLQTCEGVDLLVPGIGELCGGSTREHRYDVLLENMKKKSLDVDDYKEYLRLAKEGPFPHGGYGLGFDRLLMYITGSTSIKDICPFPRYYEKAHDVDLRSKRTLVTTDKIE